MIAFMIDTNIENDYHYLVYHFRVSNESQPLLHQPVS